jgi:cytochrome c
VVLRAEYTDRGANGLLGARAEATVVLRAPSIVIAGTELSEGVKKMVLPVSPVEFIFTNRSGAYARLKQIDLTGLSAVVFAAAAPAKDGAAGGKVEVRLDSATGPLVGETDMIRPTADATPLPYRVVLQPTPGERGAGSGAGTGPR